MDQTQPDSKLGLALIALIVVGGIVVTLLKVAGAL